MTDRKTLIEATRTGIHTEGVDDLWMQYRMEMPVVDGWKTVEEALQTVGAPLKTRERDDDELFSVFRGQLATIAPDRIVVIGHNTRTSPRFIWIGTPTEFAAMWETDF